MNALDLPEGGLLEFPCTLTIKAMGRAAPDFDAHVAALVRQQIPQLGEGALRTRPSKGGNYLAVSIEVTAESREQLDAIYQLLSADDRVLMAL